MTTESTTTFRILTVESDAYSTTFTLDGEKQGCARIRFEFNELSDFRGILLSLFQSQRRFDFEPEKSSISKGSCRPKSITQFPSV